MREDIAALPDLPSSGSYASGETDLIAEFGCLIGALPWVAAL
jgi:hypothetical protein